MTLRIDRIGTPHMHRNSTRLSGAITAGQGKTLFDTTMNNVIVNASPGVAEVSATYLMPSYALGVREGIVVGQHLAYPKRLGYNAEILEFDMFATVEFSTANRGLVVPVQGILSSTPAVNGNVYTSSNVSPFAPDFYDRVQGADDTVTSAAKGQAVFHSESIHQEGATAIPFVGFWIGNTIDSDSVGHGYIDINLRRPTYASSYPKYPDSRR